MAIQLALVDDQHLFREGLAGLLKEDPDFEVRAQGSTSADAVEIARRVEPELLLLNVDLNDSPVPATVRSVLEASPSTRIVMLTMHRDVVLANQLLAAGAVAFLSRALWISELKAELTDIVGRMAEPASRSRSEREVLSSRELQVLRLAANGMSNRQIGNGLSIAEGTVKRHMSNIFARLQSRSRIDAIIRAERLGYRLRNL